MKSEKVVQYCQHCKELTNITYHYDCSLYVCDECGYFTVKDNRLILFCGFCRGECKGENWHYVSPSTDGF
jgi:hypothetical protein